MKTLIIHNNNISNIDKYTENISFTSINDVIKTLNSKEFDIIYIKDNLSLNCLDFIGIELDDTYFETCKNRVNEYIKEQNMQDVNVEIA